MILTMSPEPSSSNLVPALADWLKSLDFRSGETLGESNQGEVRRFRFKGFDLAIKTPKGRGLARWLRLKSLRREHRIYQVLEGVAGFPHCYGLFHDRYLVLEFISGSDFRHAGLPDRGAFFGQLLTTIEAMHERGIAHGDLKRKDNLRVDPSGRPVIIDLGTAVRRKEKGQGSINRKLFAFIRQTDLNAWIKLKYGRYHDIPGEDAKLLRRSRLEQGLSRWWPGRR